ncbi:MAG: filamentous hemagglutinin N-terminal domain-containing protein [Nostocales cyanobacterium 94392]|nr:filamentous hemagglutinin N-terminal domain-containing protein [Nostocales cyanobacterium 94392]
MFHRDSVLFGLSVIFSLSSVIEVKAQLVPDNTLGKENSIVTPTKLLQRIDGGAIRGSNLFHSFKEFNIDNGKSVYFSNPSTIQNILTRVTGENPSNIFGKLGVLGNANLFLLNPNGIIFGENARLDISGSFSATTSASILFDNGFEFSATNPNNVPLLKLNITPGLQYPRNQQEDISNQGNLTVGKDLNLIGKNLDLTGSLNAGSDLKLQASDTLQIRDIPGDRKTLPFIANAGGNLLLQANQSIDIQALNHPDSGLFSGKDLILQSATPVQGDARYFSGGSFRIERLDGSLGDLESPNDPIIRASGDVNFDSYTGASLHILAGGTVDITGDVTITGADGENGLQETVILSDGESLSIDGKNQATLDIRAGTNAFGTPGVAGSGSFTLGNPNTGGSGSSRNIVIGGNIKVNTADGLVFLSNQYSADSSLSGGNIQVEGNIDTSSNSGNGGRIIIDSRGGITTNNGLHSYSDEGIGGNVDLLAGGDITLNSSINISSNTSSLDDYNYINIVSNQGSIFVNEVFLLADNNSNGYAGDIAITADDLIEINNSTITSEGYVGQIFIGQSEDYSIIQPQQIIINNSRLSSNTNTGILENGISSININSRDSLMIGDRTRISANTTSSILDANDGGSININTDSLKMIDGSLVETATKGSGNGGDVNINAKSVMIDNAIIRFGPLDYSSGDGGNVKINAENLTLRANASFEGDVNRGATGKGGNINFNVTDTILLDGASSDVAPTGESTRITVGILSGGSGVGGDVKIKAGSLIMGNGAIIKSSAQGDGIAGDIHIDADIFDIFGSVPFDISTNFRGGLPSGLFSSADGNGKANNITVNANSFRIADGAALSTRTNSNKPGGDITVNATDKFIAENGGQLLTTASSSGKAGSIFVNAPFIELSGSEANLQARLDRINSYKNEVSEFGYVANAIIDTNGNSGLFASTQQGSTANSSNIAINAVSLSLQNNAEISASSLGSGEAGDIIIDAKESIRLFDGSGITSEAKGEGTAGELKITTGQFNIINASRTSVNSKKSAGDITINADSIMLDNKAKLTSETNDGISGDIKLQNLKTLSIKGDSLISATTIDGEAGDIFINTSDEVKIEDDSKIASGAVGTGIAGFIDIITDKFTIKDNSQATVSSKDSQNPGYIFIEASDVNLTNQAKISATTDNGISGDITLKNLNSLILSNNSDISASTIDGIAGDIMINAFDSVKIESNSKLESAATGNGEAGFLEITAKKLTISDNSQATVGSKDSGDAGYILVEANNINLNNQAKISATTDNGISGYINLNGLNSLILSNNSDISASTIDGIAGDITINAFDSVKIESNSKLESAAIGKGEAGFLEITTKKLTISDNSQATVSSKDSQNPGYIFIEASDVNLTNQARISATTVSGISGYITLDGLNLLKLNNSEISASTVDGVAGDITINAAESIELTGKGGLSVQSTEGGIAGSVAVNTSQFFINDEAQVTVSSKLGQAGNLKITTDNLFLDRGILTAETGKGESSEGANITLDIKDLLLMRNNSLISATAFDTANGGNITINNDQGFLIGLPFENSDIIANADQGNGGDINITTQNIFGLVFREKNTAKSDITASSKFGLNGEVTVDQLNVNPASGLVELPSTLVETTGIQAGCAASNGNNFVVRGKGGLPQSPDDLFRGETTYTDLFDLVPTQQAASNISDKKSDVNVDNQKNQIIEATGWAVDDKGNVILVAKMPDNNSQSSVVTSVNCESFSTNN